MLKSLECDGSVIHRVQGGLMQTVTIGDESSSVDTESVTTVLLVEDQVMLSQALNAALADHPSVKVVGAAGSVAEPIEMGDKERPDLDLMAYRFTHGNGI